MVRTLILLCAAVAFDCAVGLSSSLRHEELASLSPSGWVKTCPKCGRAPGGSPNCCSPGGSWFGKCSVKLVKGGAPTFPEGFEACNDKAAIERKQEHEKVRFTAERERDVAEKKATEDVDALVAATKRDAEAEADERVEAAKREAEADADRRVEAVKRDVEATADRRVAKEAARALKAEEEKAKVLAGAKEVQADLTAREEKERAEVEAKQAEQARVEAETKEAETAQKLMEFREKVAAEQARKAEKEAEEVARKAAVLAQKAADKVLRAEADRQKVEADVVILAAAQKASMKAAQLVAAKEAEEAAAEAEAAKEAREAKEAAAAEEERDRMEAETLRAEAAEAEQRAALKEAAAMKLEAETENETTDAASEQEGRRGDVAEADAASEEVQADVITRDDAASEQDQSGDVIGADAASGDGAEYRERVLVASEDQMERAAAENRSDAAEPSSSVVEEARETLKTQKEQADAIEAAREWQSREIVVPRDGICEPSTLSDALRSVVVTTKDGTCRDSSKWKMLDPSLNLRMYDDKAAEELVRENYPDLLATYQGLAHGVERADLFRYLAIHHEGGIYADCDVEPNACVSKWLTEYEWFEGREGLRINASVPLLIVGVEFDAETGWVLDPLLNNGSAAKNNGTSRIQLCQWVFAATKPRHPALVSVMGEVQARMASFPDNQNLITDRTGPVAWTAGVMRYIRRHNVSGEDLLPVRKLDHHGQLFQLREPSGVESQVLLLPYRAFAYPGAHGPGVFEEPSRQKLVHHMFKGSWKPSLRHEVTHLMGLADGRRVYKT